MLSTSSSPSLRAAALLLAVLLAGALAPRTAHAQVSEADSLALVAFFNATDGPNWDGTKVWPEWLDGPVSSWGGVTVTGGRVTKIILNGVDIKGSLPAAFGDLTGLVELQLTDNELNALPLEFWSLPSLVGLYLADNQLTGALPPEIAGLTALQTLSMPKNQLSGSIPPEIATLPDLAGIVLNDNQLTGTFPAEIWQMTGLVTLDVSRNDLAGELPATIGHLTDFTSLLLSGNRFTGTLPTDLGSLVDMTTLFISDNQFTGAIPPEIAQWPNFFFMAIQNNRFSDLPDLSAAVNLFQLSVENNRFEFDDIEPNVEVTGFTYAPQDSFGVVSQTTAHIGEPFTLTLAAGGSQNLYRWFKDDVEILGQTSATLTLPAVDYSDAGTYRVEAISLLAPLLTLYGRPTTVAVDNPGLAADSLALVALYNATNGPGWTNRANWLTGPVSTWHGVTVTDGRVRDLQLGSNALAGPLPPAIGDLTFLENLWLVGNGLTGSIPSELGNLVYLKALALGMNNLTGTIPTEIGRLIELQALNFDQNQLTGGIPPSIGGLTGLKTLSLGHNQLSGTIPTQIGGLTDATRLVLAHNQFTGDVFDVLQPLVNLEFLELNDNQFTGSIPPGVAQWEFLTRLELANNRFSDLPDFSTLFGLSDVSAENNRFEFDDIEPNVNIPIFTYAPQEKVGAAESRSVSLGDDLVLTLTAGGSQNAYQWFKDGAPLPDQTNATLTVASVMTADAGVYHAEVTSPLAPLLTLVGRPTTVTVDNPGLAADSLALVALYNATNGPGWTNRANWLTGPVSTWFGVTVADGRVSKLELYSNNLAGSIPPEIAPLAQLKELDLSDNQLTSIPPEIGELIWLEFLSLNNNQLTSIPSEIAQLDQLTILDLSGNQLTSIPADIAEMPQLGGLFLSSNQLTSIPPEIGRLPRLKTLLLSSNQLTSIPSELGRLTQLWTLSLDKNQLTSIPPEIGQMTQLNELDLSGNQLTSIPPEIAQLAQLTILDLSGNQLTSIPPEIAQMPQLGGLFLSSNQLTSIPAEIVQLTQLVFLQLAGNQLSDLPDLSSLSLSELTVENNRFEFDDIVPNVNVRGFTYAPQDPIGTAESRLVTLGNAFALAVTAGGAGNVYQWFKDAVRLPNETSVTLTIDAVVSSDAGVYHAEVTNPLAPLLTLVRRPTTVTVDNSGLAADSLALVALYNATNGPGWANRANWLTGPVSTWHGVTVTGGRVTGLALPENRLQGELPAEIGNLSRLEELRLQGNSLTGQIPVQGANLTLLKYVDLSNNQLSGKISAAFAFLTELEHLDLSGNAFEGEINLEEAFNNRFAAAAANGVMAKGGSSATFDIDFLPILAYLDISQNNYYGAPPSRLPSSWAVSLGYVYAGDNAFEGELPPSIGRLGYLKELSMPRNGLTGSIPPEVGEMTSLFKLDISYNLFDGYIPSEILKLRQLESINIEYNKFSTRSDDTGWSTDWQAQPYALIDANLGSNRLGLRLSFTPDASPGSEASKGGSAQSALGSALSLLTNLARLNLSANHIDGEVPPEIGLLAGLTDLDLGWNRIVGGLPDEIGNLTRLDSLTLAYNHFSGSMPLSLTNITGLKRFDFNESGLEVPDDPGFRSWLATIPKVVATGLEPTDLPERDYGLSEVYPNPFARTAHFSFHLETAQRVTVAVYNLLGQRVAILHDGLLAAGTPHTFAFEAAALPSGLYMIRAQGDAFSDTRPALLIH